MQAPKEYPNMEMVDRVVNAMKDKGWSIQVIAIRTGIESEKL